MNMDKSGVPTFRSKLYRTIFEAETPSGRAFDIVLLSLILISVIIVSLESVASLRRQFLPVFQVMEWSFTIMFTIEYFLRMYSTPKPLKYIFSFFGIIDLLAIMPTYLSLFIPGAQYFLVIRVLRMMRIARILKLTKFINEGQVLSKALRASVTKILVFIGVVVTLVVVIGSLMYVIESAESGFTSIPQGIYWAIVTLTTVGYGDLAPVTPLGKILASFVMIMGYGIIAVPTGIVSVELARADKLDATSRVCPNCHKEGHSSDAKYCDNCAYPLYGATDTGVKRSTP